MIAASAPTLFMRNVKRTMDADDPPVLDRRLAHPRPKQCLPLRTPVAAQNRLESARVGTGDTAHLLFIGNPPKVLALVLRNRGNGDLKCSAKDDVRRMLNACDATTVGNRSA
jgi:hypothetical protein